MFKKGVVACMSEQNSVTQSNYLIRGRRGEGITLREQKLLYLAISMIEPDATEISEFHIRVRDLYELLGLGKTTPAKDLKETADKLLSRRLELPTPGKNDFDFINIVSRCSYIENEGEVVIRINKDIEPFLLKLRGNFTSYTLYNILKLKSEYSIALFQFLKSYVFQEEVTITLVELKDFLFFEQTKYPQYSMFKRDILKKCLDEINDKTELKITFEEIKKGRTVHALKFNIREVKETIIEATPPDEKIRGKKSIQLDRVLVLFQQHGIELNALDGYKFISKAKTIWGDERAFDELSKLIKFTLNDVSIQEPIKFIYYQFKGFETNLQQGLAWDHGFFQTKRKKIEVMPNYEDAATELTAEEIAYYEKERQKILDKLHS